MAPRIDAHQHFWRYAGGTHPWIGGTMGALDRDFLPADLAPLLADAGFDGCVAVQAEQSIAETEWLLALAGEHDFIRGVVGWVDLCAGDAEEQLRRLTAHPKLRGIRHLAQGEADERSMLGPGFTRGVSTLAAFDLACDLSIYPGQMTAAAELVRAFPQQRFVLDDLGRPDLHGGESESWARGIAASSRNRNVACKLSSLVTGTGWSGWTPERSAPFLDVALTWFPPDRLMIGSDWPVCTLAAPYQDAVDVVLRYVEWLSPAGQEAVLGGTAARFYGL